MDGGNLSIEQSFKQGHCWNSENIQSKQHNVIPDLQTFLEEESDGEGRIPCNDSIDHLDFILPSTPESLLTSGSEHNETSQLENESKESNFTIDFTEISGLLSSTTYIEQTKSQTLCNTMINQNGNGVTTEYNLNSQNEELVQKQKCEEYKLLEKDSVSIWSSCSRSSMERDGSDDTSDEPISKKVLGSDKKNKKGKACSLLQFPPCVICSGTATGSHYGAITCEACKGFFRRHLQKKTDFKCKKGGNCEIVSNKKGICSGCRLKKCLELGMSKEKSKMGRYTLTKRTEAIINMNIHEKKSDDSSELSRDNMTSDSVIAPQSLYEESNFLLTYLEKNPNSLNLSCGFNDLLVKELVQCLNTFEPYGQNVKTKEQIKQAHLKQSERYRQKTEIFGKMKNVSRDEYNELYLKYGIDIDGRMADMKLDCEGIENDLILCCNFARHIPEFHNFPVQDQVTLLNTLMIDFFTVVTLDCYDDEYQTFLSKNGRGYHLEEVKGREFSDKLVALSVKVFCRLQSLNMTLEEKALIGALLLVSADHCKLQNRAQVESVQLSLTELLQQHVKKSRKEAGRFTKIIDTLTYMREYTDQQIKENNEMCKNEVYKKEFPFFDQFFIEENC